MTNNLTTCPIEETLKLINRKWVVILIRDLFIGKKRFSEFQRNNPKLNNNVLSSTLHFMEENSLITKQSDDESTYYMLTEKGKHLNGILYQMVVYGLDFLMEVDDDCESLKRKYKEILEM